MIFALRCVLHFLPNCLLYTILSYYVRKTVLYFLKISLLSKTNHLVWQITFYTVTTCIIFNLLNSQNTLSHHKTTIKQCVITCWITQTKKNIAFVFNSETQICAKILSRCHWQKHSQKGNSHSVSVSSGYSFMIDKGFWK